MLTSNFRFILNILLIFNFECISQKCFDCDQKLKNNANSEAQRIINTFELLLQKKGGGKTLQVTAKECFEKANPKSKICSKGGKFILFNPKYTNKNNLLISRFLMAHEMSHYFLGHFENNDGFASIENDNKKNDIDEVRQIQEYHADVFALIILYLDNESFSEKKVDLIMKSIYSYDGIDTIKTFKNYPSMINRRKMINFQMSNLPEKTLEYPIDKKLQNKIYISIRERLNQMALASKDSIDKILLQKINENTYLINQLEDSKKSYFELEKENKELLKSNKRNNDSLEVINIYNKTWEKLKTHINKSLIDSLNIADSLSKNTDWKIEINTLKKKIDLANTNENYVSFEPIFGCGKFNGQIHKYSQKLDSKFSPQMKFGIRIQNQDWDPGQFFLKYGLDLTANISQLEIYNNIEGKNNVVERIKLNYAQILPNVGLGYRLPNSNISSVDGSTKSNFFTFSIGIPVNFGRYYYKNYFLGEKENIDVLFNDICFECYKTKIGNRFQKFWNTKLLEPANFAFTLAYNHSSRIGGGLKKWKKLSSYSLGFTFQKPFIKINLLGDKILNQINKYEFTVAYRWWR